MAEAKRREQIDRELYEGEKQRKEERQARLESFKLQGVGMTCIWLVFQLVFQLVFELVCLFGQGAVSKTH